MACMVLTLHAQNKTDLRCQDFLGIPLEGNADTMAIALKNQGFTEWGGSDDGEDMYFRGKYFGLRARLLVNIQTASRLVRSAHITIGSYRTREMLLQNMSYLLGKLSTQYGTHSERNGAYYFFTDYGSVKLATATNGKGSTDITVFYLPRTPFYKDALLIGLRGYVREVSTQNAVSENPLERFTADGRSENPDLIDRKYDQFGYLTEARMLERTGTSVIKYEYDSKNRIVKRTLKNDVAGISYINEYTYDEHDEIINESQKVLDGSGDCLMSVNMRNNYDTHDEEGNWTRNQLTIVYWEKDSQSQTSHVTQTRKITYWDED